MIENIQSKDDLQDAKKTVRSYYRLPKNIKQIGQIEGQSKTYIEDYVITYIHQEGSRIKQNQAYVLLGQKTFIDSYECLFVNGIIKIENTQIITGEVFSNDIWADIYKNIKEYFEELDILGWCVISDEWNGISQNIENTHISNFSGQDKILFIYDFYEKEELIYKYKNTKLAEQKGYYVYYERNDNMQNYMVLKHGTKSIEYGYSVEKRNIAEPKNIITREKLKKENYKKPKWYEYNDKKKKNISLKYIITMLLIAGGLALGAKKIEQIDNITKNKANEALKQVANLKNDKNEYVEVDTILGKVDVTDNADKKNQENESSKENIPNKSESDEETKQVNSVIKDEEDKEDTTNQTKTEDKKTIYYIVKKGDSLVDISILMYGTKNNVDSIKKANNITDEDKIYEGQKLIIP